MAIGPGEASSKRIAVGVGAENFRRADIAAGAADIFDDHRLPPFAAELVGQHPRQQIGAAAGRVGHDQLDDAGGKIGLRMALPKLAAATASIATSAVIAILMPRNVVLPRCSAAAHVMGAANRAPAADRRGRADKQRLRM